MLRSAAILAAMRPDAPGPDPRAFQDLLACDPGPMLDALAMARFGGGASRMVARALEDRGLAPPSGLEPAAFAFVVAGALGMGAPPWPMAAAPAADLAAALRVEPDLLDQVAVGGAARFTRDPALRERALAWRDGLVELAPALHASGRRWAGERPNAGERVWALVGGGPDVSAGLWTRPVIAAVIAALCAPEAGSGV
jgi:hypothetical protein